MDVESKIEKLIEEFNRINEAATIKIDFKKLINILSKKYKNILKNYLECDPGSNKETLTNFFENSHGNQTL